MKFLLDLIITSIIFAAIIGILHTAHLLFQ